MKRCLTPLAALALAGCMASTSPLQTAAPPGAMGAFATNAPASIDPVPDDWWRLYDDPALDQLVEASLAANADLRVAYANLDGARAALRQAQNARLPQVGLGSGLTVDATRAQPSAGAVPSTDWDIAATASWDVDLFGRLRSAALAARADVDALKAARDSVRVAVVADTVLAYVDFCGANHAIAVAQDVARAQETLVRQTQAQFKAGDVSPLEVSQAASLAANSRAAIPLLEAQRANALYRLVTLEGQPPAEASQLGLSCVAVPRLRGTAPVGDGTALLLRRPDIREAERKLAAATARIGVARADLYPRVNLGGAFGLLTGAFDAAVTPLVSWSFPTGPARAKVEQARATERGALASWDATVLKALHEVETALANYDAEVRRGHDLGVAADEARTYARRVATRVQLGDAAGLLQTDAERSLATARLLQAQSQLAIAQAQVALFRALGGGWRTSAAPR